MREEKEKREKRKEKKKIKEKVRKNDGLFEKICEFISEKEEEIKKKKEKEEKRKKKKEEERKRKKKKEKREKEDIKENNIKREKKRDKSNGKGKHEEGILGKIVESVTHKNKKKNLLEDNLKAGALKRLNKLSKGDANPDSIENLNKILRVVLKDRYKINESLTVDEIKERFEETRINRRVKVSLLFLLVEIQDIEYGSNELPEKETLNKLINEFKKVLEII